MTQPTHTDGPRTDPESVVRHTPGPWEMRPAQLGVTDADALRDCGIGAVIGDQNYCIAEAFWRVDQLTFTPVEANARLIAAAPDLLEALELILPLALGYKPEGQTATARQTCDGWIAAARVAIAKATP